jgi:hypothetical protein
VISVSPHVSEASVKRVRAMIEAHITRCQEKVALKVYNYIISADTDYTPGPNLGVARTPEWSGAFKSSWRIQSGSVDSSHATAPERGSKVLSRFAMPGVKLDLNHTNYKMPIFVSNMVADNSGDSYAGKIENVGTPYHEEPWKIAANAVNVIRYMKTY